MAIEFQIITSQEFVKLGAHGELQWPESLAVLAKLAKSFIERGTDRALLDVRDARIVLSDEQVRELVGVLKKVGFRGYHRLAVLRRPHPRAGEFTEAARERGYDFGTFLSYELAAEWLSAPDEEDPDFDRETYHGPATGEGKGGKPPEDKTP
jgi:hypothetical protein